MAINTIRPVYRSNDGLKIFLTMSDWPLEQIPLPPDITLWCFGDEPSRPYWHFFLRPEITVEKIVGIFKMPLAGEEVFVWYQTEMHQRGWTDDHGTIDLPSHAFLLYRHPTEDIKMTLFVKHHVDPIRSWVILSYVTIQPWPNVTAET